MNWIEIQERYDVVVREIEIQKETKLRLAQIRDINALVDAMSDEDMGDDDRLPYWSALWPVSIELARYTITYPVKIQSPVIELGCGLGLNSIVAAGLGFEVLATDYELDACSFTEHNAQLNGSELKVRQWDWRELSKLSRKFNTILGADLLYEPKNIRPLAAAINHLLAPGGSAIIADPNRPHWPQFQDILTEQGLEVKADRFSEHVFIRAKRINDPDGLASASESRDA